MARGTIMFQNGEFSTVALLSETIHCSLGKIEQLNSFAYLTLDLAELQNHARTTNGI